MSKVEKVLVEVDTLIMYAGWADDANCRHLYAHINNLVSEKIKEHIENSVLDPWEPNTSSCYDKSIHSNPDAKAWADFFINTFPGLADKHDLMHTWFANAMMAIHDHLLLKQQKQQAEPQRVTMAHMDALHKAIGHVATLQNNRLRFKSACEISGDKHPEYVRGMKEQQ